MATKSGSITTTKSATTREPAARPAPQTAEVGKSPQEVAHYHLLQMGDLIQNRLGRILREYELTLSQYHVLRILEHAGAALPSLEIALRMPQVVPAITGLLTRLEQQAYVRRKQDKEDKRVTQVEITPKAKTLLKKLEKPVLDLHRDLAATLTEPESKQLAKLLEKLALGAEAAQA